MSNTTTPKIKKLWAKPEFWIIDSNEVNNKNLNSIFEHSFTSIPSHPGHFKFRGGGSYPLAIKDNYVS